MAKFMLANKVNVISIIATPNKYDPIEQQKKLARIKMEYMKELEKNLQV